MVSRAVILQRAATIWPTASVPYSQVKLHQPDGYRQDCSGFASLCWALPAPGENTVTLVTKGIMVAIGVDEILPGDAVGKCGPGTDGNDGHIQIVNVYNPITGSIEVWEQAGGVNGPRLNKYKRITPGFTPWRFVGVGPTPPSTSTGGDMIRLIEKDGRQYIVQANALSETGFSWVDVTDDIQPQVRVLTEAWGGGMANTADARTNKFADDSWKAGAFGRSTFEVRRAFIDEVVARVVSKLPAGPGGAGATPAQVAAAVRAELDATKLGGL